MGIGEIAPLVKAGLAGAGFLLGVMGVAAGGALNPALTLPGAGVGSAQPQASATSGAIILSSKRISGEDLPGAPAEVQTRAVLPTPTIQATPRPTFVPKPYSAPAPPTTPSQAEELQKLHSMETQIADADRKLHTVTYVPPAAGAAQPQPGQQNASHAAPAASAPSDAQAPDQTDATSADQTDQSDQTDQTDQNSQ